MFGPPRKRKSPLYIATSIVLIVILALVVGGAAVVVAGLVLLIVLFYPLFLVIWDKLYGAEDISDQLFYAHTEDGWNIAMHFHRTAFHPDRRSGSILLTSVAKSRSRDAGQIPSTHYAFSWDSLSF